MEDRGKSILYLFLSFLTFFFIAVPFVLIFSFLGIDYKEPNLYVILDFFASFVLFVLMILIQKQIVKTGVIKMKTIKVLEYLKTIAVGLIIMKFIILLVAVFSSVLALIFGINIEQSENQVAIESMVRNNYLLMAISACIFAPLTEELVFRGAIKRAIKNKWVFITVSGLIFGLMHITNNTMLFVEILVIGIMIDYLEYLKKNRYEIICYVAIVLVGFGFIYYITYGNLINALLKVDKSALINGLSYISAGCYLAYVYAKTDNIFVNVGIHTLNNLLSMILLLFL